MRAFLFSIVLSLLAQSNLTAQTTDSIKRNHPKTRALVKNFTAPVSLFGLGLYLKNESNIRFNIRDWRNDHHPNFSTHTDDVLQFVPIGIVYGLDLLHVRAKNDMVNRSLLLAKSELMMTVIVRVLKNSTDVTRPGGTNHQSFPSGHTAQAFVAATFLHKEFGDKSVWYSIGAYTMASTVGALRIMNNKHWISDVLAGAGIGILSTNMAYATHKYKWGKRPNLVALPTYSNGPGIYVAWRIGN